MLLYVHAVPVLISFANAGGGRGAGYRRWYRPYRLCVPPRAIIEFETHSAATWAKVIGGTSSKSGRNAYVCVVTKLAGNTAATGPVQTENVSNDTTQTSGEGGEETLSVNYGRIQQKSANRFVPANGSRYQDNLTSIGIKEEGEKRKTKYF